MYVDVLGQDVDVVQELLVYAVVAALLLRGAYGVEFVEAVYGHVGERHLAPAVAFGQLAVEAHGRAPRGEAQYEGLCLLVDAVGVVRLFVAADHLHDRVGHVLHAEVLVFVDLRADFLVTVDDVARRRGADQSAVLRQ